MEARWPRTWVGTWRADDGKTVTVQFDRVSVLVTVRPSADEEPYVSAKLLDGGHKKISLLPGLVDVGPTGVLHLSVEAGTDEIGPRYHLYPMLCGADGALTRPAGNEPPGKLALVPEVTIGLYDDWDDDLGVPWAFPLSPLTWRVEPGSGRGQTPSPHP